MRLDKRGDRKLMQGGSIRNVRGIVVDFDSHLGSRFVRARYLFNKKEKMKEKKEKRKEKEKMKRNIHGGLVRCAAYQLCAWGWGGRGGEGVCVCVCVFYRAISLAPSVSLSQRARTQTQTQTQTQTHRSLIDCV